MVNEPEQGDGVVVPPGASSPIANAAPELVSVLLAIPSTYLYHSYSDQDLDFEGPYRHNPTSGVPPPPLGVKLTGYRLLNMSVMFSFFLAKGILTYMGRSVMPTTLDWFSGGVLSVL